MKELMEVSEEEKEYLLEKRHLNNLKLEFKPLQGIAKENLYLVDYDMFHNVNNYYVDYIDGDVVLLQYKMDKYLNSIRSNFSPFVDKGTILCSYLHLDNIFWSPKDQVIEMNKKGTHCTKFVKLDCPNRYLEKISEFNYNENT